MHHRHGLPGDTNQVATPPRPHPPHIHPLIQLLFLSPKFFTTERLRSQYRDTSESSTYSQVSSTTGPGPGPANPRAHHGSGLVLSLTQLQGSGGLVILNSASSSAPPRHHGQLVTSPAPATPTTPSPRPEQTAPSQAELSSASRGEVGSVSAAVNTLNNIHEFGLEELHSGGYDTGGYGAGLAAAAVTDSLLSGSGESRKSDEESVKSDSGEAGGGGGHQAGPLLDFKSAFSDLETKEAQEMSFLHDTLDMSHEELQRALASPAAKQPSPAHQQQRHAHSLHSMDYVSIEASHHAQSHAAFADNVNLDAFDILSDFPELSQYDSVSNGHPNNGLLNHGHGPGPMLSQVGLLNFYIDTVANTQYLEC